MAEPEKFSWLRRLLVPLVAPVAIIVGMLPFARSTSRTAEDVAVIIGEFLNERGDDWDWDDFTSVPIADPWLDAIRREADAVALPLDEAGRAKLEALLTRLDNEKGPRFPGAL